MPKLQNNDQKKEESDYSKCENVKPSDSKKTVSSVQDFSNLWKPHSWCRAIRSTDGIEYEATIIDHIENQRANVHFFGMEIKHDEIKPLSELKTSFGKKERDAQWLFLKLKDSLDVELNNQNSKKGFQQLFEEAINKLEKNNDFSEKENRSMKESRNAIGGNIEFPNLVPEYVETLEVKLKNLERSLQLLINKIKENQRKVKEYQIKEKENQRKENQRKESQICKICMDKKINTVLVPCGHLQSCDECAAFLNICPWCRKLIDSKLRVYMSHK